MSVTTVENWSDITGTVRAIAPSSSVRGFGEVVIAVERVKPVEGFANLLGHSAGTNLTVLVPDELITSHAFASGDVIECRVRRASPERAFVHREHISVHRSK